MTFSPSFRAACAALLAGMLLPSISSARTLVFAETWENGTASWRTQRNNGSDCKGWPTCPFDASELPNASAELRANPIWVKNGDGADGRDVNTCSGKYVNVPRAYAGWDAGNLNVVGGVSQGGTTYRNAQFPVHAGDRLCVVAWVRAYPEADENAGPMIGINYTGAHGVVDAGHNHGTHWMIGPLDVDPANWSGWQLTLRTSYGPQTQLIQDGAWHRYKAAFPVNSNDVSDRRRFTPEGGVDWVPDGVVYGQPRISLYGRPPERADVPNWIPPVQHDADFGDLFYFRADAAAENPCPTDAELEAMAYSSDHAACGAGATCTQSAAPLPAGAKTPAQPNNQSFQCLTCAKSFGDAAPAVDVCTALTPFCIDKGIRGGTCTACSAHAGQGNGVPTECPATAPLCEPDGSCGKCETNADCPSALPTCDAATGACFACKIDHGLGLGECLADAPRCDATTGLCSKCAGNADCADPEKLGTHIGPSCNVESGACMLCTADFGMPPSNTTCSAQTPFCQTGGTSPGTCGSCTQSSDCVNGAGLSVHPGPFCEGGSCKACDGDSNLSKTPFACTGAKPTCGVDGFCTTCRSDVDCTNPVGRRVHIGSRCNLEKGVCEGPVVPITSPDGGTFAPDIWTSYDDLGCQCDLEGSADVGGAVAAFAAIFGLTLGRLRGRVGRKP